MLYSRLAVTHSIGLILSGEPIRRRRHFPSAETKAQHARASTATSPLLGEQTWTWWISHKNSMTKRSRLLRMSPRFSELKLPPQQLRCQKTTIAVEVMIAQTHWVS